MSPVCNGTALLTQRVRHWLPRHSALRSMHGVVQQRALLDVPLQRGSQHRPHHPRKHPIDVVFDSKAREGAPSLTQDMAEALKKTDIVHR